uniref:cDNA FLJ57503 n=1 Tax=Homo sapiens TaxID=9606 RepID=B4DJP4_HUMAN|nr:unnamed protein product [Homo sapiens]|eukprot:NP_001342317.1 proline-rich protein 26 isoform 2 [Homo sapiens]
MESSRWDKDPPGERRPQQSQHWRARDHGARGCGPRQPTATASPRPGLWITPAHGSHTPQTNTRRTQADNIFIYALATLSQCPLGASGAPPPAQVWDHRPPRISTDPVLTCITPMMASQRGFRSPVGLPHQRGLLTSRATNVDTIPSGTTYFCIPSTVLRSQGGPSKLWNNQTRD